MNHPARHFLLTLLLSIVSVASQGATAQKAVKVPAAAQAAVGKLYATPDAPLLWFAAGRPTASALGVVTELTAPRPAAWIPPITLSWPCATC